MFGFAMKAAAAGKDFTEMTSYVCPVCGNIEFGNPPDVSPICGLKAERFGLVA
jgi:rubrerythrin